MNTLHFQNDFTVRRKNSHVQCRLKLLPLRLWASVVKETATGLWAQTKEKKFVGSSRFALIRRRQLSWTILKPIILNVSGLTKGSKVTSAGLTLLKDGVRPVQQLFHHHKACSFPTTAHSEFCHLCRLHRVWTKPGVKVQEGPGPPPQWVQSGLIKGIWTHEQICARLHQSI